MGKKWLVSFSAPKTKEMVITKRTVSRDHPDLVINNQTIERVTNHKHLGLILSSDLTWGDHVLEIAKKGRKLLNFLYPLKMYVDRRTLEQAYISFIRPIFEYGDVVWDSTKTDDHTYDMLEKINADAARLVSGPTARCHLDKLYEENKWETLSHRRKNHRLTVFYKMVYGLVPEYLLNLMPSRIESRTRHNLRNKNEYDSPFCRINAHKYSFLPSTIRDWNDLDNKLKESPSIESFKKALSRFKEKPPPPLLLWSKTDQCYP